MNKKISFYPVGLFSLVLVLVFSSCAVRQGESLTSQELTMNSQVVKLTYPSFYYTKETLMGREVQLKYESQGYDLSRQDESIEKTCNVYLPPGYDSSKTYKVVYILHGIGGDENSDWIDAYPSAIAILDDLILSKEIEPVIGVFPNGRSTPRFRDRSFENQAGFYFFANELKNDLIPFIESKFSVREDRNDRLLCGLSMGGMQTINLGLSQSLEYFSWFGAFSAAPSTYNSDQIAQKIAAQNKEGNFPIHYFYNICGLSDEISISSHGNAMDSLVEKTEYLSQDNFKYVQVPGGHDYRVWQIGLREFLKISASGGKP